MELLNTFRLNSILLVSENSPIIWRLLPAHLHLIDSSHLLLEFLLVWVSLEILLVLKIIHDNFIVLIQDKLMVVFNALIWLVKLHLRNPLLVWGL